MKKKRAIILGAGITGLSAAFTLQKTHDVILLEQSPRAGGWIKTEEEQGFIFEAGPRTFRYGHSPYLLSLVHELGLDQEIIFSNNDAKCRYLLFKGQLEALPSSPFSLFSSPLIKGVRKALLTEWLKPAYHEDETLWQFAERRFGVAAAERFFDPLAMGIYAVGSKQISVDACFPSLKEMERKYGSITKALFKAPKKKSKAGLFSFRHGVGTLIKALEQKLRDCLHLNHTVQEIIYKKETIHVVTSQGKFEADLLVSALPPKTIGRLLINISPSAAQTLQDIAMTSLTMVQLGYNGDRLKKRGFGYLVPSVENLPLLGVVFDSAVFPEHNRGVQTRLTAMLQETDNPSSLAQDMVEKHLGISEKPDFIRVKQCINAIPLLEVGHRKRMQKTLDLLRIDAPNIFLAGNYLSGVSVNDCIGSGVKCLGNTDHEALRG